MGLRYLTPLKSSTVAPPFSNTTSLIFNGSNNYVSTPTNAFINPDFNTPFWCSFWLKTTQSGQPTILSTLSPTLVGIYMLLDSGLMRAGLWHTPALRSEVETSMVTVNDGSWHSVIIVNSGSGVAGGWTIYVDGASAALSIIVNTLAGNTTTSTTDVTIGADLSAVGSPQDFYSGKFNQFSFTQGATINSSQATAIFNSGTPAALSTYSPAVWQYLIATTDTLSANGLMDHGSAGVQMTAQNMTGANISMDVP